MTVRAKTAGVTLAAAVFFILDRTFKWLFVNVWSNNEFKLLGEWLKLKLTLNRGIAFSLPLGGWPVIILTIAALFILIFLAWLNQQRRNWIAFISLAAVIAGAMSNLLDRIYFKMVIDYINVSYFSVFNLADVMIVFGIASVAFLTFNYIKAPQREVF